jgi:hypothetical protein
MSLMQRTLAQVNSCYQAIAQACAFRSPEIASIRDMAICRTVIL